ncbi:addiction module protein [Haloferula chungangensis]|uniref:Addiction module protein n=1 Tax=Haloferula chungangensis TaxID=1048331 RepID=A0ABW2LEP4_9BACT
MNLAEVSKLSGREKLQLMDALWEDMRQKADEDEFREDHLELVRRRWAKIESGESKMLDWDAVKDSIGR